MLFGQCIHGSVIKEKIGCAAVEFERGGMADGRQAYRSMEDGVQQASGTVVQSPVDCPG